MNLYLKSFLQTITILIIAVGDAVLMSIDGMPDWYYGSLFLSVPAGVLFSWILHCNAIASGQETKRPRSVEWISVEDELPVAPIGRVHILVEEEYIGQGMPKPPIKMLRMGDYADDFCQPGESGYWQDDYGNRIEVINEGGVEFDRVTHWARQIPYPGKNSK